MYEVTGDRRYREIAEYFLAEVLTARNYVIGNTSLDEHWRTAPGTTRRNTGLDQRRVLRGLQPDEAGAAGLRLDRRCALDGCLRARSLQLQAGHAERAGAEAVLLPARRRLLARLQLARGIVLVLHRHRRRGIRQVRGHDLSSIAAATSMSTSSLHPRSIGKTKASSSSRSRNSRRSKARRSKSNPRAPLPRTIHVRIPGWTTEDAQVKINGRPVRGDGRSGIVSCHSQESGRTATRSASASRWNCARSRCPATTPSLPRCTARSSSPPISAQARPTAPMQSDPQRRHGAQEFARSVFLCRRPPRPGRQRRSNGFRLNPHRSCASPQPAKARNTN